MKIMKSNALVYTSIVVTAVAIVAVLAYSFLPSSFKESSNSQTYIAFIIVLTVVTIFLGLLQTVPLRLKSRRNKAQSLEELELEAQIQELSRRSSEYETRLKQRSTPVKVTIDIKGTPLTIESSDVSKVEDIIKLLTKDIVGTSSVASQVKSSINVIRESEGTYKVDDTSAQS
jgi:hypothetical protein